MTTLPPTERTDDSRSVFTDKAERVNEEQLTAADAASLINQQQLLLGESQEREEHLKQQLEAAILINQQQQRKIQLLQQQVIQHNTDQLATVLNSLQNISHDLGRTWENTMVRTWQAVENITGAALMTGHQNQGEEVPAAPVVVAADTTSAVNSYGMGVSSETGPAPGVPNLAPRDARDRGNCPGMGASTPGKNGWGFGGGTCVAGLGGGAGAHTFGASPLGNRWNTRPLASFAVAPTSGMNGGGGGFAAGTDSQGGKKRKRDS